MILGPQLSLHQMALIKVLVLRKQLTESTSVQDAEYISSVLNYSMSWAAGLKKKLLLIHSGGHLIKAACSPSDVSHQAQFLLVIKLH